MLKKVITVNGDTLTMPELKRFSGKKVEITLKELTKRESRKKNLMEFLEPLNLQLIRWNFKRK